MREEEESPEGGRSKNECGGGETAVARSWQRVVRVECGAAT